MRCYVIGIQRVTESMQIVQRCEDNFDQKYEDELQEESLAGIADEVGKEVKSEAISEILSIHIEQKESRKIIVLSKKRLPVRKIARNLVKEKLVSMR